MLNPLQLSIYENNQHVCSKHSHTGFLLTNSYYILDFSGNQTTSSSSSPVAWGYFSRGDPGIVKMDMMGILKSGRAISITLPAG